MEKVIFGESKLGGLDHTIPLFRALFQAWIQGVLFTDFMRFSVILGSRRPDFLESSRVSLFSKKYIPEKMRIDLGASLVVSIIYLVTLMNIYHYKQNHPNIFGVLPSGDLPNIEGTLQGRS